MRGLLPRRSIVKHWKRHKEPHWPARKRQRQITFDSHDRYNTKKTQKNEPVYWAQDLLTSDLTLQPSQQEVNPLMHPCYLVGKTHPQRSRNDLNCTGSHRSVLDVRFWDPCVPKYIICVEPDLKMKKIFNTKISKPKTHTDL